MTRALVTLVKRGLCVAAIVSCLMALPAHAQVQIVISPPAWFIATSWPVYFEGHATYWYGDRWYYRDGGAWRYYREEPAHLRDYRGQHDRGHQNYGRGHEGGHARGHEVGHEGGRGRH